MRVLILTGKFGMGHDSASRSLCQQLQGAFPQAQVEVIDFFAYAMPAVSHLLYKGFAWMVTWCSDLFNAMYRHTENDQTHFPALAWPLVEQMARLVETRRPDAVIATHPFCVRIFGRCKEELGLATPLIACVTDVTAHSEWLCDQADAYLVADRGVAEEFARKGVAPARIRVTGIPVKAEFKRPPCRESGDRQLLIMGGGLGLMPKAECFYEGLNALPGVHTTVITGNNHRLFQRLSGRYENLCVLGYTPRVYDAMACAHLMLSKPGGVTLFEALFSGLPMLAWEPFLEQERHNADFLVAHGIGAIAPARPEDCLAAVQELLFDDQRLGAMSARMARMRCQLADHAVEELLVTLSREGSRVG